MSEGKHDLASEFPQHRDRIATLKQDDRHFARLYAEYDDACKQLHRIGFSVETPSDEYVEALKLRRVRLKGDLCAILSD
jgi:uncharacterized protein YdcH (DUF465 family)